jgi:hypothetical protein
VKRTIWAPIKESEENGCRCAPGFNDKLTRELAEAFKALDEVHEEHCNGTKGSICDLVFAAMKRIDGILTDLNACKPVPEIEREVK